MKDPTLLQGFELGELNYPVVFSTGHWECVMESDCLEIGSRLEEVKAAVAQVPMMPRMLLKREHTMTDLQREGQAGTCMAV